MKKGITVPIDDFNSFKIQMLNWANQFNIFCFLDNHQYHFTPSTFECLLAVGCKKKIEAQAGKAFELLTNFSATNNDWLFGHFAYDLKNEIELLDSNNIDHIGFADMFFFVPEIVISLSLKAVTIYSDNTDVVSQILSQSKLIPAFSKKNDCNKKSNQ